MRMRRGWQSLGPRTAYENSNDADKSTCQLTFHVKFSPPPSQLTSNSWILNGHPRIEWHWPFNDTKKSAAPRMHTAHIQYKCLCMGPSWSHACQPIMFPATLRLFTAVLPLFTRSHQSSLCQNSEITNHVTSMLELDPHIMSLSHICRYHRRLAPWLLLCIPLKPRRNGITHFFVFFCFYPPWPFPAFPPAKYANTIVVSKMIVWWCWGVWRRWHHHHRFASYRYLSITNHSHNTYIYSDIFIIKTLFIYHIDLYLRTYIYTCSTALSIIISYRHIYTSHVIHTSYTQHITLYKTMLESTILSWGDWILVVASIITMTGLGMHAKHLKSKHKNFMSSINDVAKPSSAASNGGKNSTLRTASSSSFRDDGLVENAATTLGMDEEESLFLQSLGWNPEDALHDERPLQLSSEDTLRYQHWKNSAFATKQRERLLAKMNLSLMQSRRSEAAASTSALCRNIIIWALWWHIVSSLCFL